MSLLFMDGYDHYTTLSQKYLASAGVIAGVCARNGIAGLGLSAGAYITKYLPANYTELIMGIAIKVVSSGSGQDLLRFLDSTTTQMALAENADGSWSIKRGTTVIATSATGLIVPSTWYYVEFRSSFHATTGTYTVKVNGVNVFDSVAGDTNQTANAYANGVTLFAGGNVYFDDFYILSTASGTNTTYIGDCRVETLLPTANGSHDAWTPAGQPQNYMCADEVAPNDDTDYCMGDVNTNQTFVMSDLVTTTGTVPAIQVSAYSRKDNAGGRIMHHVQDPDGASAAEIGSDILLSDSYMYQPRVYELNTPGGSIAWTIAAINAFQMGLRVVG